MDGTKTLHILVDSKSLAQGHAGNPESLGLLRYAAHDFFDIKATSVRTGLDIIDSLPRFHASFETIRDENQRRNRINQASGRGRGPCEPLDIGNMARRLYQKQAITAAEWKKTFDIFAHACFYHGRGPCIHVTCDGPVLQGRGRLRRHQAGRPVNIVAVREGKEMMDNFAKGLRRHIIAPGSAVQHHCC